MDASTFNLMQTKDPIKSYIKTILGKVFVNVLNPFTDEIDGIILVGNPKEHPNTSIVDIWSEKAEYIYKKSNQNQFEQGTNIPNKKEDLEQTEEER